MAMWRPLANDFMLYTVGLRSSSVVFSVNFNVSLERLTRRPRSGVYKLVQGFINDYETDPCSERTHNDSECQHHGGANFLAG